MSGRVLPVEVETGIPLAIVPHESLPRPGRTELGANWHHPAYPKSRPEFKTVSGAAIRLGRVEWVTIEDHNTFHYYYDDYMVDEWRFPRKIAERFGMTVMLAAKYVPPVALRFTNKEPEYTPVNEELREELWGKGILKIASEFEVHKFLTEYTLAQDIPSIASESDIDNFLHTTDDHERIRLGNMLLNLAALVATDSIRSSYLGAYKKKLIAPDAPANPERLIVQHSIGLGTEKRRRKARTALRVRLIKELDPSLPLTV